MRDIDEYRFTCSICGWTTEASAAYGEVTCPQCSWSGEREPYMETITKAGNKKKPLPPKRTDLEQRWLQGICDICPNKSEVGCSLLTGCEAARRNQYDYMLRRGFCPIGLWDTLPAWDGKSVDILFVARRHDQISNRFAVYQLQRAGINAVAYRHIESVINAIKLMKPRLVYNRSFPIPFDVIDELAPQYPDTVFLNMNLSCPSYMMMKEYSLTRLIRLGELATKHPNVFLGTPTPDNAMGFIDSEKIFHTPHPVGPFVREIQPVWKQDEILNISLIGRKDFVKNFGHQMLALAKFHKEVAPMHVQIVCNSHLNDLLAFANYLKLPATVYPWDYGSWEDYMDRLEKIHIGMCCSYSETFCFAASDHISLGLPVVGSSVIKFLPPEWQARPNEMQSIFEHLVWMVENPSEVAKGIHTARELLKKSTRDFVSQMKWLLSVADKSLLVQ